MSALRATRAMQPRGIDRRELNRAGLLRLGDVLAAFAVDNKIIGECPLPAWWHRPAVSIATRRLHGLWTNSCVLVRVGPDEHFMLLLIDRFTGAWSVPTLREHGDDLLSLAEWLLALDPWPAAQALARAVGLKRVPTHGGPRHG